MTVSKIEIGWINDDFCFDRLTGKVFADGNICLIKIYENGSIFSFPDQAYSRLLEYEYIENPVTSEFLAELRECLNVEVFTDSYKSMPKDFSFGEFVDALVESRAKFKQQCG